MEIGETLYVTTREDFRKWSEKNRARARKLIAEGRMTEAGLASLPNDFDQKA